MPGTGLANFREQYPQYVDMDDEELAGFVKQRYYPEMPELEYRDAMGLPPPPEPEPEPSMWDRATSIFQSEENKPTAILDDRPSLAAAFELPGSEPEPREKPALLRDQFFAGWDEYRANRASARAFGAVGDLQTAEDEARGVTDPVSIGGYLGVSAQMMSNFSRNQRARQGDAEAEEAIQRDIADRRSELTWILQQAIDQRSELMERTAQVPYSQATREMLEAKGFRESASELGDDPIQIIAEVGIRSLPNMADAIPMAVGGALVGGPLGFAGGMGVGAAQTEYRASFADALQQEGVNLTSAESLIAAAENPELMARAHEFALKRSSIIGAASMLSGGIASKPLTPFVKQAVARELTNVAAQTVVQAGIEGAGEAAAQLATEGEIRGGEVLAEAIGGSLSAPIDVAGATVSGARAQMALNEAARIESEVNDMIGRDYVPRGTPEPDPETASPPVEPGAAPDAESSGPEARQDLETSPAAQRVAELEAEFDALPTDQKANPRNFTNQQLESARTTLAEERAAGNLAVDETGSPLMLYRGEHGDPVAGQDFQTRSGSLTFVDDPEAASLYAESPNVITDTPVAPRVAQVQLDIKNPIINTPDDPFIDGDTLVEALGFDAANDILIDNSDAIMETNGWEENLSQFDSVADALEDDPANAQFMPLLSFRVFDDADAVQLLKAAGYDGAIYASSGDTLDATEYRVFDENQIFRPSERIPVQEQFDLQIAPKYADTRLRDVQTRRELQEAAADIDSSTTTGRRAHRAVNRAITGRALSEAENAVVGRMLTILSDEEPVLGMSVPSDTLPAAEGDRRGGQRGRGPDRRQAIQNMSLDELVDKIYTDPLTGIANRRAFDEDADRHAWVAEIDADSLKWINDNISEEAGDAMLIAVAEAIDQTDVDAYRIGGDEYVLGGATREEVEAAAELAKGILANQQITDTKGVIKGLHITYGVGQSKEIASASLKQNKTRREEAGKRSPRGVAPPGAELTVSHLKPVDMAPGTNYVSIIGNTGTLPIDANNNMILGNGRRVRIPKKPVRREHILAVMQRAFGARIYQGRVKGKTRLGFYRPGQGEIRIKNANDIEVAAHEVAHWLDDRYPWISRLYNQYKQEVSSVSYDVTKTYEGWAEFMRLFMTQEYEVIKRTPSFYDAFREELAKHPALESTVYDLQELMHAWTQQGARARLASKHGAAIADFFERIRTRFTTPLLQSALDGLRRIRDVQMDVDGTDTAYRKLRLALGGSNAALEAAMFYGTPGWRADGQGLEFTGVSLRDIFGNEWGSEDLALYMMARRGRELAEQGRENLMRPDEIAAGLALATEQNDYARMFGAFQQFNQRMLDFSQDSGILGAETRKMIEEMNQNYVPFHRVIESEIEGRGVRGGGNPFQRLKGGTQNVANIWDNIINNNGMLIRMAMVNDGKRTLLRSLSAIGTDPAKAGGLGENDRNQAAGKYASPITTRESPVGIQKQQVIRSAVEAMGISWQQYNMAKEGLLSEDPVEARLEQMVVESVGRMEIGLQEFVSFWQTGLDPAGSVDFYMQDGKKVWFEIGDAALWDSLQHLGPKGTNMALGILGGFSSALRRGVVAVPVFQVKNFIRDTTNAWLLSDHVKVPAVRAMGVVFSHMQQDPAYQLMMLNGGGFANRSQGLQAQRKIIIDPTRLAANYDRFMGRFENANRLAEYKASREAGDSPSQAAMLSREISTDFAMRGSSETARFLSIAVPFLNARLQGNYRVARQFTRREAALSYAMRGTALATATLALYALNKDDDRYKELPEDIKDLNWVFFNGDGEDDYFLMPKPFESGMLWGTIPERMFELTEQRDGKEFTDAMLWMFLETFNMDLTPQVFQPELDLQRNKNFTGAPIIPFYLENVEPSEQYTWYTSETMREAGKRFNISPIKLEHRVRGYLGTLGTYALGASDALLRAMSDPDELAFGEEPTRGETWKENIIVRGLIDPLVGEGPPRRTKYVTDLYDMIREAQLVANTTDLMLRRQNQEVEAYLQDPEKQAEFAANDALQNARRSLGEIRKQMDLVRMSQDFDGDEKRVKLWELQRQRNEVGRQAVLGIQAAQAAIEEQARAQ